MRRFVAAAGASLLAVVKSRAFLGGLRFVGGAAATLAVLALIGFGVLMLLLAQGPIEINSVGTRVAAALTQRFDGAVQFSFGSTQIARTSHGPTITVDQLQAVAAGHTIISAPRAELSLDPIALLRLEAAPSRIEVFDLFLRLIVTPDGALAISAGGPNEEAIVLTRPAAPQAAPAAAPPTSPTSPPSATADAASAEAMKARRSTVLKGAADALRAFFDLATSPRSPIAALTSVAVHGGSLVIDDRAADRTTTFDQLEMALDKGGKTAAFMLAAQGPNGKIKAIAKASGTPDTERRLDIEMRDLSMDEIALVAGLRRPPFDSDASGSFKLRFVLEGSNELREASGRAVIGAGFFRLEDPDHEPMFFDEISGGFHWDKANRRIIIDPVQYFGGETQFVADGALDPPVRAEDGWRLTLGLSKPGAIAPDHPGDKTLVVEKASIDARIFIEDKRCELTRAEISGPDLAIAAAGGFDWVDGLHVRLGASAGQMPIRALFRVWPSHMGAPARTWLIGHALGGMIQAGRIAIDFDKDALLAMRFDRPPPDNALQLDFQVANGSVAALPGVPTVTGIDGVGRVTGRTAAFTSTSASMETAPGRRLAISGGSFSMPNNDGAPAIAVRLETRVSGSMETVADLLSKDAISGFASLPLEPGSLKGHVDGKLRLDFKIGKAAAPGEVKVYVNAAVANFAADHLLGKEKFEAGSLVVTGDPNGIHAAGTGRMFGGAATLDLRKGIGQPAVASLTTTVDEAARVKLGLSGRGIAGPIGVRIGATLGDRDTKANVEADFSRTTFDNPIPGLVKAAGKPGRATFTLIQRESSIRLEDVVFEAGGATARGVVDLSAQGEFQAARFSQARLSPGDEMRVEVTRAGDTIKTVVRGATIDARPFLKSVTEATDADGRKDSDDFDLDLKVPILSGFSKRALANAELRLARKGGALRQFAMSGQFGRAPFSAVLARGENGQPQVNVSTADAGALLAFSDLYARMDGGALTAAMQFADKTVNGMITINSFALRDEPALRRLVNASAPRVEPNSGGRVDPSLARFDRLQVGFSRGGGRLYLRDGVMHGPNIGLTVEGTVDTDRETMALNGTFVPAYTVNNFFSKIPVVGLLLGGGWNEGLFAVNYKVSGRPNAPQISINPLTVAPGFLRKIFGALDNATTPPPAAAPPVR